jgi:DNA-binding CsgD family transcriptional regulator
LASGKALAAIGKKERGHLTATQHRARAQWYRRRAMQYLDHKIRQELMLLAMKHEALAEELERVVNTRYSRT